METDNPPTLYTLPSVQCQYIFWNNNNFEIIITIVLSRLHTSANKALPYQHLHLQNGNTCECIMLPGVKVKGSSFEELTITAHLNDLDTLLQVTFTAKNINQTQLILVDSETGETYVEVNIILIISTHYPQR